MSTAGVVTYKIHGDGSLEGRWTHRDLGGMSGRERACGGPVGSLPGQYRVEIDAPGGETIFEGSLTIGVFGDAYALTWSGRQLGSKPQPVRFSGIGTVEGADTLVATFQQDDPPPRRATLREVWDRIPGPGGERFAEALRHGTLRVVLYAPRKIDPQTPHEQDEVYVVVRGSGSFDVGGLRRPFAKGDVLFVPAGIAHRFEEFSDDLVVWALFYGPRGGEPDVQAPAAAPP